MKLKKEYLVLFVVIAAAIAYLATHRGDRSNYELPPVAKIDRQDIEKIEIVASEGTINLQRQDQTWKITPKEYPVDDAKIDRILDTVAELALTAMVSESKNYTRYELDDDQRIRVRAWQGSELKREFDIGKTADTFRHTFVRVAGDERVFHARENFRNRFDTTVDDLRDKSVLSFKPEDIETIRLENDGVTTTFARQKTASAENGAQDTADKDMQPAVWQTADGSMADARKVTALLSALSGLTCQRYIEDKNKTDFKTPALKIVLTGPETYSISIFDKLAADDAEEWSAVSSQNDYVFVLSNWKVEDMKKDLLPDKPEPEQPPAE